MNGERATAASMSADPSGRAHGRTLAGLIDVLDRADGAAMARRPQPRRTSSHRPSGARSGAVRTVPLRSVRPAPMARPAPAAPRAYALPEPERAAVAGLADLVRRAALWGAGPRGEHLAWRPRSLTAPVPVPRAPVEPAVRRPGRLRGLVRRAAMWGAGPRGEHLAWGGPVATPARREVDPPVVLREMPSTPTIQPVAPSPAAALLPRGPASSAGPRGMPPVPRGAVAVPGVRPCGPPERSRATGWPAPNRMSPVATGLVRTRGDPVSGPARGSPPPARRARSPGSAWSSFP
ncbi:MAG TPA: hypothetical protein VFG13_15160 [Blastococcus sp.]|nr:hypothetical protein [Blastococcus sp.]